jgi:hypothetical protein
LRSAISRSYDAPGHGRRKDGSVAVFLDRASKTRAARLDAFVSVGFVLDES